jgi:molybdate transport system regulatory protein
MARVKASSKTGVGARLKIVLGAETAIGPGKADLLDHIVVTGSIAAAGRQMAMSYRRAWLLVDEMNHMFKAPVVTTAKGGKGGGGCAVLTDFGREVLARYRNMQAVTAKAIADDLKALHSALAIKRRA